MNGCDHVTVKPYLWTLKCEVHIIFTSWNVILLWFFFNHYKDVETILSPWVIQNRKQTWHGPGAVVCQVLLYPIWTWLWHSEVDREARFSTFFFPFNFYYTYWGDIGQRFPTFNTCRGRFRGVRAASSGGLVRACSIPHRCTKDKQKSKWFHGGQKLFKDKLF